MSQPADPSTQGMIAPGPVPLSFSTGQVPAADGTQLVVLSVSTPVGLATYFLNPETALALSGQLRAMGRQSRLGLTIVGAVNGHDDDDAD